MGWSPSHFGTLWEKGSSCERNFHPVWSCASFQNTNPGTQEVQASDEKSVTVNINGSTKKSDNNEANSGLFENPQTQSRRKYTCKMSSSSIQPEQPHRVARNSTSAQLPLSLDSGLKDDHTNICHSTHQNRISNKTNIEKKIEVQINFPAPNDKIWKNIDKELEKLIPENFKQETNEQFIDLRNLSTVWYLAAQFFSGTFWEKGTKRIQRNLSETKTT